VESDKGRVTFRVKNLSNEEEEEDYF